MSDVPVHGERLLVLDLGFINPDVKVTVGLRSAQSGPATQGLGGGKFAKLPSDAPANQVLVRVAMNCIADLLDRSDPTCWREGTEGMDIPGLRRTASGGVWALDLPLDGSGASMQLKGLTAPSDELYVVVQKPERSGDLVAELSGRSAMTHPVEVEVLVPPGVAVSASLYRAATLRLFGVDGRLVNVVVGSWLELQGSTADVAVYVRDPSGERLTCLGTTQRSAGPTETSVLYVGERTAALPALIEQAGGGLELSGR